MKNKAYIPLYCRSYFSLLKEVYYTEQLCAYAARQGYAGVGMADIGNFYGLIRFIQAAKRYNIKPVGGVVVTADDAPLFTAFVSSPQFSCSHRRCCLQISLQQAALSPTWTCNCSCAMHHAYAWQFSALNSVHDASCDHACICLATQCLCLAMRSCFHTFCLAMKPSFGLPRDRPPSPPTWTSRMHCCRSTPSRCFCSAASSSNLRTWGGGRE